MYIDYIAIGTRIRHHRLQKCITQEELAFQIETSAAYISNIECGKKKPSLQKLIQISEVLDVTINDFVYNTPPKSSSPEITSLLSFCPKDKQEVLLKNISQIIKTITTQ